jgi:hypothetical protein
VSRYQSLQHLFVKLLSNVFEEINGYREVFICIQFCWRFDTTKSLCKDRVTQAPAPVSSTRTQTLLYSHIYIGRWCSVSESCPSKQTSPSTCRTHDIRYDTRELQTNSLSDSLYFITTHNNSVYTYLYVATTYLTYTRIRVRHNQSTTYDPI